MSKGKEFVHWLRLNGFVYCIGYIIRKAIRNKIERKFLKNSDFTIISQNCIGGVMLHDLGQSFNTPTINLFMTSNDYIIFLENLKSYIGHKLSFVPSEKNYPKAQITVMSSEGEKTINLYFPHDNDENKIQSDWERRSKRVRYDNLFIIAIDRDGLTPEILERFNKLSYKNKILLSSKKYLQYPFVQYYKKYKNEKQLTSMLKIVNVFGKREYGCGWNYIQWLNNGKRG